MSKAATFGLFLFSTLASLLGHAGPMMGGGGLLPNKIVACRVTHGLYTNHFTVSKTRIPGAFVGQYLDQRKIDTREPVKTLKCDLVKHKRTLLTCVESDAKGTITTVTITSGRADKLRAVVLQQALDGRKKIVDEMNCYKLYDF